MTLEDIPNTLKEKVMKTINYSKNIAMATVAALGVASLAMGAHADESVAQVPARTVHYSDLNLNTQAGAEMLYGRIRRAAGQVCGDVGSRQLADATAARICVDRAVTASVRAVNNQRLTNTYNAHFGVAQTAMSVASVR
jgi:UrcA family protein